MSNQSCPWHQTTTIESLLFAMKFVSPLLIVSVSAFTTKAPSSSRLASLNAIDLDSTFGTTVETGNKCPPLGKFIETEQTLKCFQNAEIKNGRVAMVASIGYMVQKMGIHFPLYLGPTGSNAFHPESADAWYLSKSGGGITFSDIAHADNVFDAFGMVPIQGWFQVLMAAGAFELVAWERQWNQERPVPGDYGFDPLGFTKRPGGLESEEMEKLRIKEIKNGRLAMVAMAGWLSEESIPGSFPLPHP